MTSLAEKNPPFEDDEDVFPIEIGQFPASHVSFFRGDIVEKNQGQTVGTAPAPAAGSRKPNLTDPTTSQHRGRRHHQEAQPR